MSEQIDVLAVMDWATRGLIAAEKIGRADILNEARLIRRLRPPMNKRGA